MNGIVCSVQVFLPVKNQAARQARPPFTNLLEAKAIGDKVAVESNLLAARPAEIIPQEPYQLPAHVVYSQTLVKPLGGTKDKLRLGGFGLHSEKPAMLWSASLLAGFRKIHYLSIRQRQSFLPSAELIAAAA